MRTRMTSVAAVIVLLATLVPSPLGPATAIAAACAPADAKPELGDVMVNQGLAEYPLLIRGKQTLVRLFLRLPTSCTTSSAITMLGASLSVERVTTPGDVPVGGTVPTTFSPTRTVSGRLTTALAADGSSDPLFLLPNSFLAPQGTSGQFALRISAQVTYQVGNGSAVTSAPATVAGGPSLPFRRTVDRRTNAFRILVVPMGNASLSSTSQFSDAARSATVNGIATFGRMGPFPDGVNALSDGAGGLRYTINPSLLDIGPAGLNLMSGGKWCGRDSSFAVIKGPLAALLDAYNIANPTAPADRVLGVVDAAISNGASNGCDEGRGEVPSSGVAGKVAWVRAIPAASKTPSITGPLIAMEMLHTVGGCVSTGTTGRCPGTFHSTSPQAETANKAYNLTTRAYVSGDTTAMRVQAATAWNDGTVFYERDDFALLACALGGSNLVQGCDPTKLVGTTNGVPGGPTFVITGSTDGAGGTSAPCAAPGRSAPGTDIVDSYFIDLTGQPSPPFTDEDLDSDFRLIYANSTGVIRDFGVPIGHLSETHGADPEAGPEVDTVSVITEFLSAADTVILAKRPATYPTDPDEILYCRTRTARPTINGVLAVQETGRIVFQSNRDGDLDIYSIAADGSDLRQLTDLPGPDTSPVVSPDGTKVAFASGDGDIWVMDLDGSNAVDVTKDDQADDLSPAWSPDGTRIVYSRNAFVPGELELWTTTLGLSAVKTRLTQGALDREPAWRPTGGDQIVFSRSGALYAVDADTPDGEVLVLDNGSQPAWSPDGLDLAFTRGADIWTLTFANPSGTAAVVQATAGSAEFAPTYAPSGRRITFHRKTDAGGAEPDRFELYQLDLDDTLAAADKLTGGGTAAAPLAFPFRSRFGSLGSADGEFHTPGAIAIDSTGDVYVADTFNDRIQKFAPDGTHLLTWTGSGADTLARPTGITIGPGDVVWVADNSNHRVQKFTSTGVHLVTIGGPSFGSGDGQFLFANDVATDLSGNVYVTDQGNRRIQVFGPSGVFLRKWSIGVQMLGIEWNDGRVYVGEKDSGLQRVSVWTDTGTNTGISLGGYDSPAGPGEFNDLWGIAVDGDLLYAVDDVGKVEVFDKHGGNITRFGSSGSGSQQLGQPRGITVAADHSIWITEAGGLIGVKQFGAWQGENQEASWVPGTAEDSGAAITVTDEYPDLTRVTLYFECQPNGARFPIAVGVAPDDIESATAAFFAVTDTAAMCGDGTPVVTGRVSDGFNATPLDTDPGTVGDPDPDADPLPIQSALKSPSSTIQAPSDVYDAGLDDLVPPTFGPTATIALAGSGDDPEDGDVCRVDPEASIAPPCGLTWQLSRAGHTISVGSGAAIDLRPDAIPDPAFTSGGRWLSGTFTVTLTASDDDAMTDIAVATFVVVAPPPPDTSGPSVTVAHTASGSAGWDTTAPVSVVVGVSDPSGLDTLECAVDGTSASLAPVPVLPATGPYSGSLSVTGQGPHAVTCIARDGVGNVTDPAATHQVKIDTVKPVNAVTGPVNGASYAAGSVPAAGCTTTDTGGSGTAATATASYGGTYPNPGPATATCSGGSDIAGNTGLSATVTFTITAATTDTTPPTVTVTGVTNGATYTRGAVPVAGCSTVDNAGGSGVKTFATRSGPTGGTVNGVGTFTVTCSGGKDNANNVAPPVSATYRVAYGGVSGLLSPLDSTKTTVISKNKTIPVKFKLAGDPPAFVTTGWRIDLIAVNCTTLAPGAVTPAASGSSQTTFKYDASIDSYVFNADLRTFADGACFRFRIVLDDGPHTSLPTSPTASRPPAPTVLFSGVIQLKK